MLSAGALEKYAPLPGPLVCRERAAAGGGSGPTRKAMTRGSCIHAEVERSLASLDWPLPLGPLRGEVEAVVREAVAVESSKWVLGRGSAAQAAAAHEISPTCCGCCATRPRPAVPSSRP